MYSKEYYKRYQVRGWLGNEKGERPFFYAFWLRTLQRLLGARRGRVLDVGCGSGYFLKRLEKRYDSIGMDISQAALDNATRRVKSPLYCGTAENLPFDNESFLAIFAFDVIEHLETPENFINEAHRILRKGGFFIFTTPNPQSYGARKKRRRLELKGLPYEARMAEWHGWRDDTHVSIKTTDEWRVLLATASFDIVRDGTDTLWDVPYFKHVPHSVQKILFISLHWVLSYACGFFPWTQGENYISISTKVR